MMKISGKRFLLLILYTPSDKGDINYGIEGRTRIVKMGFLFEKEIKKSFERDKLIIDLPEFFPWLYGPFSNELVNDLEFLVNRGFINIITGNYSPLDEELEEYYFWSECPDDTPKEYLSETFMLTNDKGLLKGEEIWESLDQNQKALLVKFKNRLTSVPLFKILNYIYNKYRDYTDKSLIKDKYLRN